MVHDRPFARCRHGLVRLADAIEEGATCVRIDLTAIVFGDVALVDVLLHAQQGPARVVLAGPMPSHLRRLFELTGTTGLFHVEA
ncbi:STAS domain-containing protein [Streptomyces sp. NPDC056362]|uniref:STAS domain-containing protein n=1 Tax=unclassified Streptomyces TaxID=2593676 RepID=UPI0035E2EE3E